MQMRLKVYLIFYSFIGARYLDHARTSTIFSTEKFIFQICFSKKFSNDNMQMRLKAYWTFHDLSLVPEHRPFIHSFICLFIHLFIHQFIYSFILQMRLPNKMGLEPQTFQKNIQNFFM